MYRNQRGAYFLAGEGGSLSRWAKNTPTGAVPGEGIEPLSKDQALAYAKYAGLSPDRFAQAGFARDEDHWLIEAQKIQEDRVIGADGINNWMQRIHLLSKNLIPHGVGLCTIFLLVQWGCAIPLVERKAKFIESEYAPYAGEGTATLCGQAVVQTRRGEFKYGAGNEAYLNPVTSYSTEWYRVSVIGGRSLTKPNPKALAYNRATRADGNGRFLL